MSQQHTQMLTLHRSDLHKIILMHGSVWNPMSPDPLHFSKGTAAAVGRPEDRFLDFFGCFLAVEKKLWSVRRWTLDTTGDVAGFQERSRIFAINRAAQAGSCDAFLTFPDCVFSEHTRVLSRLTSIYAEYITYFGWHSPVDWHQYIQWHHCGNGKLFFMLTFSTHHSNHWYVGRLIMMDSCSISKPLQILSQSFVATVACWRCWSLQVSLHESMIQDLSNQVLLWFPDFFLLHFISFWGRLMFLIGCSLAWLENVIESQMFLHVKLLNT